MFATQVLPETVTNDSEEENNSEIVGLIIVDGKEYELKRGETKIGRDPTICSIVIENSTVSKIHAVVESEGRDDIFIYDVGSTNQTKLGKKVLKPHCRYKLDDKSVITLGNIVAKFVIPPDKRSDIYSQEEKPVPLYELNDLGDIFDIPTQVTVSQPCTSSTKVSDFEILPENFEIFTVPNSASLSSKSSKSCLGEDTQGRSDSPQTKQRTVFGSFENSGIFSLGTQCQLYELPAEEQKRMMQAAASMVTKNNESDEIKSLLNDGQDEVLCTFMSLHSPTGQSGLLKEIKTENLTQEEPTPAQVETIKESIEKKERRELRKILQDEDLVEDFPAKSKPSITSTPVSRNLGQFKIPDRNDSCTQHVDEDFIQTQEFNVNRSESTSQREVARVNKDNVPEDVETQPYVSGSLDELPGSQPDHDDEDLILTQAFEIPEKRLENKQTRTEETTEFEEDFLETQIFPGENRIEAGGLPEKSSVGRSINFTERNDEDDFIETQVFEETADFGKTDERSDRIYDRDFKVTQRVDKSVNKTSTSGNEKGVATTVRIPSRESSPDLLTADAFPKNSEDCISTQIFQPAVDQDPISDVSEQISSRFESDGDVPRTAVSGSSGDETESDLEIILEKNETGKGFIKCEQIENNPRVSEIQENDDSNSSYIFELDPENQLEENQQPATPLSDSDATDCEEIEIMTAKIPGKQESRVEFDEVQVLNLTDGYSERAVKDWATGAESPKYAADSPLSLELPNTQEIETNVNRILRNAEKKDFETPSKTEVRITERSINSSRVELLENPVDTPSKRPRDNSGVGVVPVKKCKTENSMARSLRNSERQFSKLVQAHDIGQIQPSRTRYSLKNITTERKVQLGNNINNERPTSRRKSNQKRGSWKNQNGDITPYLTRKVERRSSAGGRRKDTSTDENRPVEGTIRVLRSSMRRTTATMLTKSPDGDGRRLRRNSRMKMDEYFNGSRVNVVFTGFDCEILERIISDLGGRKTNDLSSGEVVVADKVRRTVKFLSAIGLSLPITSPQWLLSSKREKKFLNPWNFILKDEESEKRWDFELRASLEKSKKVKLLKGFSVFATKSTKPPVKDLLAIVEFCGGTPLFNSPDIWPKKSIIVSCPEDKKWWPLEKYRSVKIVHYEFILSGVLRQKIDFKTYKLR